MDKAGALASDMLRPGAGVVEAQGRCVLELLDHSLKYSCGEFLSTFMFRGNTDGSDVFFTGTKRKRGGCRREIKPGSAS